MFPFLLLACTSEPEPEASPPPFDLDGARAYFAQLSGQGYGVGALIISKEADCESVGEEYLFNDLDRELFEGEGLMFLMEFSDWSNTDALDWTGLWLGYGYGADTYRTLTTMAYSSGLIYALEWGYSWYGTTPTSWVDIASMDGGPSGRFHTTWWEGEFQAEDCGRWDTGWDTGWTETGWWETGPPIVETGWWETGTTDTGCEQYQGDVYLGINEDLCAFPEGEAPLSLSCADDDWEMVAYSVGWSGGGDLEMVNADATDWVEVHPVEVLAFDSDGYWDQLVLSLEGGVDQTAVVEGTTTHFECDQQTGFRLTLYDTDNAFADCKEWGAENGVFDGTCGGWD